MGGRFDGVGGFRSALMWSAAVAAMAASTPAWAQSRVFQVPAQDAVTGIPAFARQAGIQVLVAESAVRGKRTQAVIGAYTTDAGFARLLAGTGLKISASDGRTVTLSPPEFPVASGDGDPKAVSEVVVTGSLIRGAKAASPIVTLSRDALDRSGYATVAEAIDAIPQNFSGQATEGTISTHADVLGTNGGRATGVNLRGLGVGSTLVLINGRRMANTGLKGDFADISTIPAIAIGRIEVLLDGASALYGSDAVAGVVNIILRRDLDGGELRVRGGSATAGGPSEATLGLTLGRVWDGGNALISYEGYHRQHLNMRDRAYTSTADLRSFGGSDFRTAFAFPGNVIRVDPVTRVSTPFWGIPAGQNGQHLTPADFKAGVLNLSDPSQGADILPEQTRQTIYGSVRQEVGSRLELSADLRYAQRRAHSFQSPATSQLTVTTANPFFVSPNASTSNQIQYSWNGELPSPVGVSRVSDLQATFAADLKLFNDWKAEAYVDFGRNDVTSFTGGIINSAYLAEALGNSPDNPATPYSPARDGFFNPYAGTPGNATAALAAIGSGFSVNKEKSLLQTANIQADGTLFHLPGGPVQLAVGAQARQDILDTHGVNYFSTITPVAQSPFYGRRKVIAGFAELHAPLVGEENARPGLRALELSAAVRTEHYDVFGTTTNPKYGIIWSPFVGVRARATYGTSFRAPNLPELFGSQVNSPIRLPFQGGQILAEGLNGGNPNLQPERATTWTAGIDFQPDYVPGLKLTATYFSTKFAHRIDRPVIQNLVGALTDPRLTSFITFIDPVNKPADLALMTAILADPHTTTVQGVFPPTAFGALVDLRYVNTGALNVTGLDLDGSYALGAWGGQLLVSANATRLFTYDQALTPSAPLSSLLAQVNFPARWRSRLNVDWTRGAWSAGASVNSVGAFHDTLGSGVSAHSTLDLRARWVGSAESRWRGLSVDALVRNAFDQAPPFYNNPFGFAYDPANADPIGRFVAVQLTRRW
jgi:iron complex outermembrane receptor protein